MMCLSVIFKWRPPKPKLINHWEVDNLFRWYNLSNTKTYCSALADCRVLRQSHPRKNAPTPSPTPYFTIIKMKSLTMLTTLFYFTAIKMKSLTTLTTLFYFTTIYMKSLTTLTTLFKFTTIKMKSLTTLTTLFDSLLLKWNFWLPSLRCFSYYY